MKYVVSILSFVFGTTRTTSATSASVGACRVEPVECVDRFIFVFVFIFIFILLLSFRAEEEILLPIDLFSCPEEGTFRIIAYLGFRYEVLFPVDLSMDLPMDIFNGSLLL